ncbi:MULTISPECIES: hypothetical protein [unclassified Bacillus (in: firmicutes)]|uniref:hypothetical protein n=1 Tax=unclassified Bacillus (in: firmicutes) TaxID=185979 RepID=UPI0008EDE27B|nr:MULTISPECIES: hypothetical protein [unclassified Bacillus (in: firmicutes)]SFA71812.1 hypothetical protein SAMN02799634_101242 [Bacillus sp. UNCCL13]SFQ62115.1 hypothetical protein SAMN04488577_0523 [Bacillus sp. cl95]
MDIRWTYVTGIAATILIIAVTFAVKSYHLSLSGAVKELEAENIGSTLISTQDDRIYFIVAKDGSISVASAKYDYLFKLYHDFNVFNSELNVYEAPDDNGFSYTKIKDMDNIIFGTTVKDEITASINMFIEGMQISEENVIPVIELKKYIYDPKLTKVKIWYNHSQIAKAHIPRYIKFLDANHNIIRFHHEIPERHKVYFREYNQQVKSLILRINHPLRSSTGKNELFEVMGYVRSLEKVNVNLMPFEKNTIEEYEYILEETSGEMLKGTIFEVDENIVGAYVTKTTVRNDSGSVSADEVMIPLTKK